MLNPKIIRAEERAPKNDLDIRAQNRVQLVGFADEYLVNEGVDFPSFLAGGNQKILEPDDSEALAVIKRKALLP
jgi:hypothetical protein